MAPPAESQERDQVLVEKYLRARDEQSFRELYRRHTSALYALAVRLCRTEADAQDIIQDTWIRACRSLAAFQWKSSLRTWLTGVLINCAREQSRKRNRHPEEELTEDSPARVVEFVGEKLRFDEALAQLPDGYRHVLTLHDVEGYTHEEIGVLLEISTGTSKSQLHYARRAMRQLMSDKPQPVDRSTT